MENKKIKRKKEETTKQNKKKTRKTKERRDEHEKRKESKQASKQASRQAGKRRRAEGLQGNDGTLVMANGEHEMDVARYDTDNRLSPTRNRTIASMRSPAECNELVNKL